MRGGDVGETAEHVEHELMVSGVGADATTRRGGRSERLDVGLVSLFAPNLHFLFEYLRLRVTRRTGGLRPG